MRTENTPRPLLATLGLMSVAGLTLTGCGWAEDIADGLDSSNSKEHQVDTGAEGKESGLLAAWVPDDARDVQVMQRTTGSERLLTFAYDGDLPPECLEIETTGSPTEQELEEAYATDLRTAEFAVDDWTTTPTLEADWWTPGQEDSTTHLCMRWWVSEDDGTFHAFAADQR
jgi:hypothetical protein